MDRNLTDNLVDSQVMEAQNVTVDNETEKAVLCLCMRSKDALNQVVGKSFSADDFADKRNALMFGAITTLYLDNKEIDRYTVFEKLEELGNIESAGGSEYVFSVANVVAVQSNLSNYLDILREKSDKRKLITTLNELQMKANKGGTGVNDLISLGVNQLSLLRDNNQDGGFESIGAIVKSNINHIVEVAGGADDDVYKTGFRKLDAMTGGFRPGTLNILAARPGMGKTALVINIATNVASLYNRPVNVFSLEMSKSEIGNRILAAQTDFSAKQLQRANIKPEDTKRLALALKNLFHWPIYVDDTSAVNPVSMMSKCKELKRKGQLGLVIVDYLQLMSMPDLGKNSSRQNEISAISRSLKILAKDLGVPVIALSQLSRDSEKRDDHTPMLSDLRDSGAIEQDADSVLFINRNSYYKKGEAQPEIQDAEIIVAKNRHGETGPVYVKWWGAKTLFFEPDRKSDPKEPESSFTRTQSTGSAASDYSFEDAPPPEPPPVDNMGEPPFDVDSNYEPVPPPENDENAAFFEGAGNDFPEGF